MIQKEFFKARNWIDFSASINPLGPSKNIQQVLEAPLSAISRYPDSQSSELVQGLGDYLGVDSSRIVVTNGATELIYLLPHLLKCGQGVLALVPIFSEYLKAFKLSNIPVRTLSYEIDREFEPPMNQLTDFLKQNPGIGAVVIGHPNSPNGRLWNEEELIVLANYCEGREILLMVDETFIDFCPPGTSAMEKFRGFSNLISIRSMTKFFALPGLRLGYGVMDSKWVQKIRQFQPPWSVNGLAQAIGLSSLKDPGFIRDSRSFVRKQREFLIERLLEMPWLKAYSSETNFILFRLMGMGKTFPKRFYYQLLKDGVLLRNCGNFEGLDETYFRIGVQNSFENESLLLRMKNIFSTQKMD